MPDSPRSVPNETGTPGKGPGAPRWVKVSAVVLLVIVVAAVVMLLVGGGDHGPGRHLGGDATPADVSEAHTPPAGEHP